MAVREYIGARYVPLFMGNWDSTLTYEPLCIVQHQGASYTSRKPVPAGTPITDERYWVCTGNYNAQVEFYRQDVRRWGAKIDQEIADRTEADAKINTRLDTIDDGLEQEIHDRTEQVSILSDAIAHNAGDIANEKSAREIADDALSDRIDDNADEITNIKNTRVICVNDFGAIGDGNPNSASTNRAAIQAAIDAYPYGSCTILFKNGEYFIDDTIILKGDIRAVDLDLNGATLAWAGRDTSDWSEGDTITEIDGQEGIAYNPAVMIAVLRQTTSGIGTRTSIRNGTIDCQYKASICIQSNALLTQMSNLRLHNFQYAGIIVGTVDGSGYIAGTGTGDTDGTVSAQNQISDCYFTRGRDMSIRPFTSAIMLNFTDNNVDNCITNRSKFGMTIRRGGNIVSNTHTTIQYPSGQIPTAGNYDGAGVRLWPVSAGDNQVNIFSNMYFNMGLYVFYTYRSASQNFTGAGMRTLVSNSSYIYYSTGSHFSSMLRPVWYGGMWYGTCVTNQCTAIYGNRCQMLPYVTEQRPSVQVARSLEMNFTNLLAPHAESYMMDLLNYCNGEVIVCSSSDAPIAAGKYKRVATIATTFPVGNYHIPGMIKYEYSHENGGVCKSGKIVYSSNGYAVTADAGYGSTSLKMYISNASHTITFRGVTFYLAYINLYNSGESAISDVRLLRLTCDSPYVDVYAFPDPTNFDSGTNQNIFDSAGSQVEVF